MRYLEKNEMHQRGCDLCTSLIRKHGISGDNREVSKACPYEICPYEEMDEFESYTNYMNSDKAKYDFKDISKGL